MSLKLQKEIEKDIHEQLYTNIFILTLNYSTTDEFNACFKKDMFIKNNKTAYLHVVHFLIHILDPSFCNQKNIWPILDVKMEVPFRNEVMKYINELNANNKETGIPLLMTSHLISPGGYKFAEFIFRLSQFVLSEHIKRVTKSDLIPFPLKANKDYAISSEQVKNMEKIVDDHYNDLIQKQTQFETKMNTAEIKIQHMNERLPVLEQDIKEIDEKINGYFKSKECEISSALNTFPERETLIEEKLKTLKIDSLIFEKCSTLIDILNENKNSVNETVVLNNTQNSNISQFNFKNPVDLIEHFQSLLDSLKNNKYFIRTRKDCNLPDYIEMSTGIINEFNEHNEKYEELLSELELYISHLENYKPTVKSDEINKHNVLSESINRVFEEIHPVIFF